MDFKPVEGVGSPANPANASQIRSDQIDNYPSKSAIGLGVVHVLLGVIVMVFAWGQPGAGTWYCNPDQNYGGHAFYNESNLFWCLGSLLFMASGSLAIAGGCKKTKKLTIATFVLSILSAIASFGLIVFASVWIPAFQDQTCSFMYSINVALVLTMLIVATISAILAGKMLIEIEIGLGIVHVLIGVIAMVFTGVFFYDDYINQVSNGWGWGFCSVLFMASGSLAIAGGCMKTKSLTIATFVLSIVSAIAAFSLLVLSSVFVDNISRTPGAEIHHTRPEVKKVHHDFDKDVGDLLGQDFGSSDFHGQEFDDLAHQAFSNFGKDLSHGPVPLQFRIPYYFGIALMLLMLLVATLSAILAGKLVYNYSRDQLKQASLATPVNASPIQIEKSASNIAIGLGMVHVLIGVIALVFTRVFYHDDYFDYYYSINYSYYYSNRVSNGLGWIFCSVLFMASGSLAIAGGCMKTKSLTIATFVFSIVSAIAAFSLFVFSSVFVDVIATLPIHFRDPYYAGIGLLLIMQIVATISALQAGKLVYNYTRDQTKQRLSMQELLQNQEAGELSQALAVPHWGTTQNPQLIM